MTDIRSNGSGQNVIANFNRCYLNAELMANFLMKTTIAVEHDVSDLEGSG